MIDETAGNLCNQLNSVDSQLARLNPRWTNVLNLYYAIPTATYANQVTGLAPYGITPWRGKCDRIVGDIVGGLFASQPYLQVLDETGDGEAASRVERDLLFLLDKSGLPYQFDRAVWWAAHTNIGAVRITPEMDEGRVVGFRSEHIDPRNFYVYPSNCRNLKEAKTIAHRYWMREDMVKDLQEQGAWKKGDVSGTGDPDEPTRLPGVFDLSNGPDSVMPEDGWVEIIEGMTRIGKKWRHITLARESQFILDDQEWPEAYPDRWYSIVRMVNTEDRVYGFDSVANSVQGLCLLVADLFNFTAGGVFLGCQPIMVVRGYSGSQAINYKPGEIVSMGADESVDKFTMDFDIDMARAMLEEAGTAIDATVGQSRLATGGSVDPNTKATAIQAMLSADTARASGYQDSAAEGLESLGETMLKLFRAHYEEIKAEFGDAIESTPEDLAITFRIAAAGRSSGDPKTQIQKAMAFLELAMNPDAPWDRTKLLERLSTMLDLPFDPSALLSDMETQMRELVKVAAEVGIDPVAVLGSAIQEQVIAAQMEAMIGPEGEQAPPDGGMETGSEFGGGTPAEGSLSAGIVPGMGDGLEDPGAVIGLQGF